MPRKIIIGKLLLLLASMAIMYGCAEPVANPAPPLEPFADFPWGASTAEVESRHGKPSEPLEELPPNGVFWNYRRDVWGHNALFKYYFENGRLTASYCLLDVPKLPKGEATELVRRFALQIQGQMQAPLCEQILREAPFTNIRKQTFQNREFVVTMIDPASYVCLTGTWWENSGKLSLNITMMRYNKGNALIKDTEARLKAAKP